jgi:hypothetical protein
MMHCRWVHHSTTSGFSNPADSLIYAYNIRGWLTGINPNYVAGTATNYFGNGAGL